MKKPKKQKRNFKFEIPDDGFHDTKSDRRFKKKYKHPNKKGKNRFNRD